MRAKGITLIYDPVQRTLCAGSHAPVSVTIAMLGAGMSLESVTRRLGYSSPDWVFKLATRHGGYDRPSAQARAQGRRLPQRVMATLRCRLSGRHGG